MPVDPFTDMLPDLEEVWGYAIQDLDPTHPLQAGEITGRANSV